jgi:hypothetical protein
MVMKDEAVREYVDQRAELLAQIVLTRLPEIEIAPAVAKRDTGIDLWARWFGVSPDAPFEPYFGVQVKGTVRHLADAKAASKFANDVRRDQKRGPGFYIAPTIIMVFSVQDDEGYWGWVMEPFLREKGRPALSRVDRIEVKPVTSKTIDEILGRVSPWFAYMGDLLATTPNGR